MSLQFFNDIIYDFSNYVQETNYLHVTYFDFCIFIAQGQYNRTRAGISVAIAMSIVIPFLICGACLILRLREIGFRRSATKQQQQIATAPTAAEPDPNPRMSSTTRTRPELDSTTFNEDPITTTKVRQGGTSHQFSRKQQQPRNPSSNHEGVYYTNEPLDMYTRN